MLAGQFVGGLAKIHRREAFLLVEIEQLLGQAEAHAQPLRIKTWKQGNVEALGPPIGERDEERRKMFPRFCDLVERPIVHLVNLVIFAVIFAVIVFVFVVSGELDLAFEVLSQQLQCASSIAHSLHVGMRRNPHNPRARQLREVAVQELPRDDPRDQIARRPRALLQLALDGFAGDISLQADLGDAVDVGERAVLPRGEQDEEHVSGRVGEELEIVGRVLVVGGDVERPDALEKSRGERVVAEERVAVHEVELAVVGVRRAGEQAVRRGGAVQAEEGVQPALHRVVRRVADGLRQLDLAKRFSRYELKSNSRSYCPRPACAAR